LADASESTDYDVDFDSDNSSGVFAAGGDESLRGYRPSSGGIAFESADVTCVASPDHPCTILLKKFRVAFDEVMLSTSLGEVRIEGLSFSVDVPVELTDIGLGFALGAETRVRLNVSFAGHHEAREQTLDVPANILIDGTNQLLQVNLWVPIEVGVTQGDSCVTAKTEMVLNASGHYPW
jgi:hypothetical protein